MDRRTIWALLLMMAIAIVPAIFLKKPQGSGNAGKRGSDTVVPADSSAAHAPTSQDSLASGRANRDTTGAVTSPLPRVPAGSRRAAGATDDTVRVTSPLYTYGISTRGGRLVEATLPRYRSMSPAERGRPAQILPPDSKLLGLTLVVDGRSI